ncbi:MAG: hypothetical protein RL398_582 [Planctomycetota bacterium]
MNESAPCATTAAALVAASELAVAAGRVLQEHRRHGALNTASKSRRRELVTAADRAAERVVVEGLLQHFPSHGILAEEGVLTTAGVASRSGDWLWIVDPLDGTTNYVHGLPNYAVAIALAWRGTPVVGVVHAPALGESFAVTAGGGAWLTTADGHRSALRVSATAEVADALLATGFSYHRNEPGRDDNLARIGRVLPACRDLRRLGSAELDLCYVAAGRLDGYWELDLQPYDMAAGAVLVREAGGSVGDLVGAQDWLFGGRVLASNGLLHEELLRLVGGP